VVAALFAPQKATGMDSDLPRGLLHDASIRASTSVEQGNLPETGALATVGQRLGATAYQVALAWVIRRPEVIAIPKAATLAHMRENRAAAELALTDENLA
jgi:diketogulonate reductase-like aldo/keto reductase